MLRAGTRFRTLLLLLAYLQPASTESRRRVVFDIGFNDGADTAHFLAQGYRVLAVEANPGLVQSASTQEPFSSALTDGRLKLLNVALSKQDGANVTFYINHLDLTLSSMDDSSFSRMAGRPKPDPVSVPSVTCASLLSEHGVPHYLKVDIEGFDEVCFESILAAVDLSKMPPGSAAPTSKIRSGLPQFISSEELKLPLLSALFHAGYKSIKCQSRASGDVDGRVGSGGGAWGDEAVDSAGLAGGSNTTRWRDMHSFLVDAEAKKKAFRPNRNKWQCCRVFHACRDSDIHLQLGLGRGARTQGSTGVKLEKLRGTGTIT